MAGGGPLEFVRIIMDFVTLGAIGLFCTVTLAIWYSFCESFVFDQGYLTWLKKRPILKVCTVVLLGVIIWGGLLWCVHHFLWLDETAQLQPPNT